MTDPTLTFPELMQQRLNEIKRLTEEAHTLCQQHPESCCNLPETASEEKFHACPFGGKGDQQNRCLLYAYINMFTEVFPETSITENNGGDR
jgi:hypothetical protein